MDQRTEATLQWADMLTAEIEQAMSLKDLERATSSALKRHEVITENLKAHFDGQLVGIQARKRHRDAWVALLPNMRKGEPVRLLFWDESGFTAQEDHSDEHAAIASMVSGGYVVPAPGALNQMNGASAFHHGNVESGAAHRFMAMT